MHVVALHIKKPKCWRYAFAVILLLIARPLLAAPSEQEKQEAAEHYRKATASFGLGDYAAAATSYEHAFALIPDHALLYNAALAHERAGNAERARTLFTNYLRVFPRGDKAGDARRHLEQEPSKSQASEPTVEDKSATSEKPQASQASSAVPERSPPQATGPLTATHAAVTSAPASNPSLLVAPAGQTTPEPASTSLWRKPWFWGALAVVAVAASVAVGFAVASSRPTETPLWGRI